MMFKTDFIKDDSIGYEIRANQMDKLTFKEFR